MASKWSRCHSAYAHPTLFYENCTYILKTFLGRATGKRFRKNGISWLRPPLALIWHFFNLFHKMAVIHNQNDRYFYHSCYFGQGSFRMTHSGWWPIGRTAILISLDALEMLFLIRAVDHARINSELKEKNLASLSIPMLTFLNLKSTNWIATYRCPK